MILSLPGLLFAMSFHEYAHGVVATHFGDPTPRSEGRLTLNPLVHMEFFGSFLLPCVAMMMGGVILGWAKPVSVDPRHFKNIRRTMFWVSFAGPLANLFLVLVSSILLALFVAKVSPDFYLFAPLAMMLRQSIYLNVTLAVFNLLPFPPLDGSKMLLTFLDYPTQLKYMQWGQYSWILFLIFMVTPVFSYLSYPLLVLSEMTLNLFLGLFQ